MAETLYAEALYSTDYPSWSSGAKSDSAILIGPMFASDDPHWAPHGGYGWTLYQPEHDWDAEDIGNASEWLTVAEIAERHGLVGRCEGVNVVDGRVICRGCGIDLR